MLLLGADRRGVSRDGWKGEIVKMEREIERGGKKYVPYYEYWSDPRILFVLGLHKHLFVFVRVIQFVCGPRIMLCAHTNLVRDSIFSGGRPIFSISHSDFRPAKYTRKSTPRPIPSPRHPPPAGSPHQCDATLTTHPPSFPCPSSREEGVGKIYTRPL
jgi:hypothetical protein